MSEDAEFVNAIVWSERSFHPVARKSVDLDRRPDAAALARGLLSEPTELSTDVAGQIEALVARNIYNNSEGDE